MRHQFCLGRCRYQRGSGPRRARGRRPRSRLRAGRVVRRGLYRVGTCSCPARAARRRVGVPIECPRTAAVKKCIVGLGSLSGSTTDTRRFRERPRGRGNGCIDGGRPGRRAKTSPCPTCPLPCAATPRRVCGRSGLGQPSSIGVVDVAKIDRTPCACCIPIWDTCGVNRGDDRTLGIRLPWLVRALSAPCGRAQDYGGAECADE